MSLLGLARASLWSRRSTALLAILAVALSVALMLGVERLRQEARDSFASTLSGVDLIVGARSGPINLLLYSVFRMGEPTANVSWSSVQRLRADPRVAWVVPLSLGDSWQGFPVLATESAYFDHYRHGDDVSLQLVSGRRFADTWEAVLGAEVAARTGVGLGDSLILAHGLGRVSLSRHDEQPFTVVGVLAPTGTPVDRTVHIRLDGMEALHQDWRTGAAWTSRRAVRGPSAAALPSGGRPGAGAESASAETAGQVSGRPAAGASASGRAEDVGRVESPPLLTPRSVTALLVGLDSRRAVFSLQRELNVSRDEPLLAILPGLALQQLWDTLRVGEQVLRGVSALVAVMALLMILVVLLASLNERRREMVLLRALGARPRHLFGLMVGEALVLVVTGILLGLGLMHLALWLGSDLMAQRLGVRMTLRWPRAEELTLLWAWLAGAILAGLWPAWRAYRRALADGMTLRET